MDDKLTMEERFLKKWRTQYDLYMKLYELREDFKLERVTSSRKCRLLAANTLYQAWSLLKSEDMKAAVVMAERLADEDWDETEATELRSKITELWETEYRRTELANDKPMVHFDATQLLYQNGWITIASILRHPLALPEPQLCEILHDVFSLNPLELAKLPEKCEYLTPDVISLAEGAYNTAVKGELDGFRLKLLADALEEEGCIAEVEEETYEYAMCAGCNGHGTDLSTGRYPEECDNCYSCGGTGDSQRRVVKKKDVSSPIMEHLRSDSKHYKGCWALDFVLGKR